MARKKKTTRRRFKSSAKRRRAAPARARSRKSKAVSRRRPAKRNPKGIFSQPAVQYGIAATGGAGVGLALNDRKDLYWMGRSPALIAAVIVLLGANFGLKGRKIAGVSGGMPYQIPTKQTYKPSAKRQAVQATTSKMKAA